jgi:serine/threonine-protein kinase
LLHRDLKPANVLLDRQGNPYVTDFGLAKLLEHDSGLTPSGGIVGTPRYMAPEQATGKTTLTTASDVYGLGCILFEILTGQPPIHEATPAETLLAIIEKEPPRPSSLNPRLPLDLETICLKCLDKDAGRRYGSAEALAEDLERFLNDEPIHARHIGAAGRLLRWCRRRPVVAGLSAALATGSVAALVALTLLWRQAENNFDRAEGALRDKDQALASAETHRQDAEAQKIVAQKQKEQAERALRQTHRAIREFCIELSTKKLAGVPGMQPVRRKLLEGAVRQYEQLVKERGNDPILVAELAATHAWIAGLDAEAGQRPEAIAGYRKAAAGLEQVMHVEPADLPANLVIDSVQADLGRVYNRLAILLEDSGQPAEAIYRKSRDIFVVLALQHPNDLDFATDLNAVENNLAVLYHHQGRPDEARRLLEHATDRIRQLLHEHPDETRLRKNLARAEQALADLNKDAGNQRAALERYERTLQTLTRLVADHPERLDYQHDLARCHRDLAREQRAANSGQAALENFEKARSLLAELIKQDDAATAYRADLADVQRQLALVHKQKNERAKALELLQRARDQLEKVIEREAAPAHERMLADIYVEMAAILAGNKQHRDALTCYQQAQVLQGRLVQKQPRDAALRAELGRSLALLGQTYFVSGQPDDAVRTMRAACAELRQAVKDAPDSKSIRQQASFGFRARGEIEAKTGHLAEGVESQLEYRELFPSSPADQYNAAREVALIASWVGKGKTQLSPDEQAERDRFARLALDTLEQALRCGFKDAARLKGDSYFQAVREHADFKALLSRLEP